MILVVVGQGSEKVRKVSLKYDRKELHAPQPNKYLHYEDVSTCGAMRALESLGLEGEEVR